MVYNLISEKPTATLNCPDITTLNEGNDFSGYVQEKNGNPPANITWFKNDKKIGETRKKEQLLTLNDVDNTDSGPYKCVAESYPHEDYQDRRTLGILVNCMHISL